MITEQAILNRVAKTLHDNFDKFGWASTLGDKFEVWFQIELCLGFFGQWEGILNLFHPVNENLKREVDLSLTTTYKGTKRDVDLLISADGKPIDDAKVAETNWSERVYAIELKAGIPKHKEDAYKDICHALNPGQVAKRVGKFSDRGVSIFIIGAQDTTIKGLRSFQEQAERIATIAKEKYANWTMLRNSEYASPNFMVVAIVAFGTEGLALAHCQSSTVHLHPKLGELLTYKAPTVVGADFILL